VSTPRGPRSPQIEAGLDLLADHTPYVHRAYGGPTHLGNLVLLCGHHHRVIHHHGWTVHIGPDGHPPLPPRWIDPRHEPRPPNATPGATPSNTNRY
jgi:hypothetical protein